MCVLRQFGTAQKHARKTTLPLMIDATTHKNTHQQKKNSVTCDTRVIITPFRFYPPSAPPFSLQSVQCPQHYGITHDPPNAPPPALPLLCAPRILFVHVARFGFKADVYAALFVLHFFFQFIVCALRCCHCVSAATCAIWPVFSGTPSWWLPSLHSM